MLGASDMIYFMSGLSHCGQSKSGDRPLAMRRPVVPIHSHLRHETGRSRCLLSLIVLFLPLLIKNYSCDFNAACVIFALVADDAPFFGFGPSFCLCLSLNPDRDEALHLHINCPLFHRLTTKTKTKAECILSQWWSWRLDRLRVRGAPNPLGSFLAVLAWAP